MPILPFLPYRDRRSAGKILANAVSEVLPGRKPVVLALPRGGVPVAFEIARELGAPLDILLVRKLGSPGHEELAMGAIASGGARFLNRDVIDLLGIEPPMIERVVSAEKRELERREQAYRGARSPTPVEGLDVILVDDGLATGSSMRVAIASLRDRNPARILVAVPVAPPSTVEIIQHEADHIVCPATPEPFYAVGQFYRDFEQTSDDEVKQLLAEAWLPAASPQPVKDRRGTA